MRVNPVFLSLIVLSLCFGCAEKSEKSKQILVKNTLNIDRSAETVSLDLNSLDLMGETVNLDALGIVDAETQKSLVVQVVDSDSDGTLDALLFQPEVKALSEKTFKVVQRDSMSLEIEDRCYSRFVPERTDDYAWENDRVAFRTYGPTAQKMVEDGVKGGTLSSGIDAWLKRVDYPIINKWYKKELETDGSYHKDTGEGLDNFHVGPSRGVGGTAVKVDTTYYTSRNYVSWKTLYNGPIRTSFILNYATWDAAGNQISEEKHISLDYGSNLSRFEIKVNGIDTLSAGLTLHENDGEVAINEEKSWLSYWEPHEDSELGTGIVVPKGTMIGHEHYVTDKADESNLFAHLKVADQKVVYYAGFSWKKSGQFETKKAWEDYLGDFAEKINSPLEVVVK
ncbi:DUF4861 domain-containing protein [uncultured Kriegella sp.]|uniref:DUF4861 domain-containing protein n=1 Tax=uncultured Kriegella sp. TaxID=1798910 RepID=UPI0030D70742|tara:strand:- start:317123 stop:318307 length:1185 start_codon:yes stop_codon:yes gene_type:complete